jgi:starch phosphorylase
MKLHVPDAGASDVARAAADLAARLPGALAPLASLAMNYRWSWTTGGPELFAAIDAHRFERDGRNPVRLLRNTTARDLARAERDPDLLHRAASHWRALAEHLGRPPRACGLASGARPIAFLCLEYGIHGSLPIYAGGLGGLAGDLLKEASDQELPFVSVGLLYRQGSFHQRLDASGWQHESWNAVDPDTLPMALVTNGKGGPLTIDVSLRGRDVAVQVWRVDVGRVPLFLLDVDLPENAPADRWIGARLYEGDEETRLAQNALLGIGGVRVLRALGFDPAVWHLNEGAAALAPLEVARGLREEVGSFAAALEQARRKTVITTHTPVPAGNQSFPIESARRVLGGWLESLGISESDLLQIGSPSLGAEPRVGMTQIALRTSRFANGVSVRHGSVARVMWRPIWPERAEEEVPVHHVTNGVHLGTWMAAPMRALLERHLGPDFAAHASDPTRWKSVDDIPDEELWAVRCHLRQRLVERVRERSAMDRLARGESQDYVEAAAQAFDSDRLTVGFARRVTAYKRLHLLTHDANRALRLLEGSRAIQLLIAGKAHPRDEEAKRTLQWIFRLKRAPQVAQRVAFLEDYDLALSAELVAGCDVWLNLPRPPNEASGTSGMKAALNGGLNLSVLDGWWAEGWDGTNGWAVDSDSGLEPAEQDARDASAIYGLLENEIVPMFHDRDASGIPREWVRRIKASLRSLGPRFSATRMLEDYAARAYAPE